MCLCVCVSAMIWISHVQVLFQLGNLQRNATYVAAAGANAAQDLSILRGRHHVEWFMCIYIYTSIYLLIYLSIYLSIYL